jgi:hypothetical protein
MAKVDDAAQKYADKQVAAALKAERKRVADGVKALALPEGTTARAGAEIKRTLKAAVAAPAA